MAIFQTYGRPGRQLHRVVAGRSRHAPSLRTIQGLTLLELLIAVSIVAILTGAAVPSYQEHLRKGAILIAEKDICIISDEILDYFLDRGRYPDSLGDVGMDGMEDPWGNPYEYARIAGNASTNKQGKSTSTSTGSDGAKFRKDKKLKPINTDYDLFSAGPDGDSKAPLTAKASRDDIIRANDGNYIGVAEYY